MEYHHLPHDDDDGEGLHSGEDALRLGHLPTLSACLHSVVFNTCLPCLQVPSLVFDSTFDYHVLERAQTEYYVVQYATGDDSSVWRYLMCKTRPTQ